MKRLFNKVLVSSYKCKHGVILEWLRLRLLLIRAGEIVAILEESEAFDVKYIEFFYKFICFFSLQLMFT